MTSISSVFLSGIVLTCALSTYTYGLPQQISSQVINPSLLEQLKTQETVKVLISMKEGTQTALESLKSKTFTTRASRLNVLKSALTSNAEKSQQQIKEYLTTNQIPYKSYWISNKIVIKNANLHLITELAKFPSVSEIRSPISIQPPSITHFKTPNFQNHQEDPQWQIDLIGASKIWEGGNRGEGIIVANIDTGVQLTHEILRDNFVGDYGWYDPTKNTESPIDYLGHGTFIMGLLAGSKGYGVAPGSKWMACGIALEDYGEETLIACGQFLLCPTDTNGENPDCSKAPHIINNSWGVAQNVTGLFYDEVIAAWNAAEIISIFAIGNSGPDCDTTYYPGDGPVEVISVGATTAEDGLGFFSGRGPSFFDQSVTKPDLSAPGDQITSAFGDGNDTSYQTSYGTSVAVPVTAGSVALLLSANPTYGYEEIKLLLTWTAKNVGLQEINNQTSCGQVDSSVFPNNQYGHGRLDLTSFA